MAKVISSGTAVGQRPEMERYYIGKAWVNDGCINCSIDTIQKGQKVDLRFEIDSTCKFELWPNTKRTGAAALKPDGTTKKDADYRLSLLIPKIA